MSNAEHGSRLERAAFAEPDDEVARLLALAGPRQRVPDEVAARVKAAVHVHWHRRFVEHPRRRRGWLAALVAAAVVVLAVGTLLWSTSSNLAGPEGIPTAPSASVAEIVTVVGEGSTLVGSGAGRPVNLAKGGAVAAGATITTTPSARVALRTPEGVQLRIDAVSRVRLVSASELVLESGAVYVDNPVTRDRRVRVEVRTPLGTASDVGTQFESRVDARGLRVRVREGAVVVRRNAGIERAQAGEELRVDATGIVARRGFPPHDPEWAWVVEMAPAPEIEGRVLGELLAWTARETGWRMEFADPRLSRASSGVVLHGSIDGLAPAAALAAVLPTCGLAHRVRDGVVWIEELPRKRP